ncbi:MAG: hypothetical protein HZB72_08315, partial [Burkholderiales bacterium]|nr:hypothetical protein [Burkholderiales bacterium]
MPRIEHRTRFVAPARIGPRQRGQPGRTDAALHRLRQVLGQVVEAGVGHGGDEVLAVVRGGARQADAAAGAQGAHGGAADVQLQPAFLGLAQQGGGALGLLGGGRAAGGRAADEVVLQARRAGGGKAVLVRAGGGAGGGHGALGLAVPGQHAGERGREALGAAPGLDGVLRLRGAGLVEADGTVALHRLVPGQGGGVGEGGQAVRAGDAGACGGRCAGGCGTRRAAAAAGGREAVIRVSRVSRLDLLERIADAFFGQQALEEGVVGLAVLAAQAPPGAGGLVVMEGAARQVAGHVGRPGPVGSRRQAAPAALGDLGHGHALVQAAAEDVLVQRAPGAQRQGKAGQAAIGL